MGIITPKFKGKAICNFDVDVHRTVDVYADSSGKATRHAEISLTFENGSSSKTVKKALSELSAINWSEIDSRAALDPQIAVARANRYIANDIQQALFGLPVTNVYRLSRPGLYKINGEAIFCTGGEVIRPPASATQTSEIEIEPMVQHLDFDNNISEAEAAAEVLNLISLFPNPGRIILSQMLVALLRQAYEDAGNRPSFCVFLHGRTGTQKTTLASFLTQIYNRADRIAEPTRLNTSHASAVEMLIDLTDQVKVFDDLFPAASSSVRKKQEETLSEITRYIGDGSIPARIKSGKVRERQPKCGVLFTGEYLIGEGSDAARLLPVEMTKPDTTALSNFQKRPLIISTFYRYFIMWVIKNYKETVSYLKEWLEEYRKTDLGVHDRLCETHFFLNSAYSLFLTYCGEKSVLSENEIALLHRDFLNLLSKLVREQNKRVCPTASVQSPQGNALNRIRELYRSKQLSIADDKRQFSDQQHDGVIHRGCLCLRPKALSRFFPSNNIEGIARELDDQGALSKGKDSPIKKISASKGKYFYWIPLSCL